MIIKYGLDDYDFSKNEYFSDYASQIAKYIIRKKDQVADRRFFSFLGAFNIASKEVGILKSSQFNEISQEELQRALKNYLDEMDSAIDYMDKLFKNDNCIGKLSIRYNRKDDERIAEKKINDWRDDRIHEGIFQLKYEHESDFIMCYQMAPTIQVDYTTKVLIEGKEYEIATIFTSTYYPLIKEYNELLSQVVSAIK